MERYSQLGGGLASVCRLGLSTRGNTHLTAVDVRTAIDAGVNYLNWCAHCDGMSEAIAQLSKDERDRVVIAKQFFAHESGEAEAEVEETLKALDTDYIDILMFYYMESENEWARVTGVGGALEALVAARERGEVRLIGLTTHQRRLAAKWVTTGLLDLIMVRYNAAHRGAEDELFPVAQEHGVPVVVYTCQRWGHLVRSTPDDPPSFKPPPAPEWYRFALAHPSVAVALMAPNDTQELDEDLKLLGDWRAPDENQLMVLREHGQRVRQHAGNFP